MKYVSRIIAVIAVSLLGQYAVAQPPARAKEKAKKEQKAATNTVVNLSERAKNQFPTQVVPQEVVWKRDIYRTLDLKKEKNASLYYPVEPMGNQVNLFTHIFRLILEGSINAYTYNLDGYEAFNEENVINPKDLLDNYRIYYEEKDGEYVVGKSDIPSSEVLSYYIKESYYYDQRTATYNQRVTAICPVLHRAEEFTTEVTKYPMFWLNYDEVAQVLAQQTLVTSSYNNISSMTIDDYFRKNCYEGEIYKTVNLKNLALNQYCKDTTAIKKEQQKIEEQLATFRTNLWETPKPVVATDSTAIAAGDSIAAPKEEKKRTTLLGSKKTSDSKKESTKSTKKKSSPRASSGSARLSVRKTRR